MSKPTITRDEKAWELDIKGEIPADSLAEHRAHVIKELQKDAKLDGFRPGKAPEAALVKAVEKRKSSSAPSSMPSITTFLKCSRPKPPTS